MSTPHAPAPRPASLDDRVDAALDVCDDILTVLPRLVERLERLEHGLTAGQVGEAWSEFRFETYQDTPEDQDHARRAWCRLAAWVDWLVATYRLTSVVPPCWPQHPTVVEELAALQISWTGAWVDSAPADAATAWQRRLHDAKARLADGNWGSPRCDGQHDGTGLDLAEHYHTWHAHPARATALDDARERALIRRTEPVMTTGGEQ